MRFFLAAKRTFCVITLYALKIRASFFKARFVANLDDYKCVACCKRVYRVRVQIKGRFFSKKYCSSCVSTQRYLNVWLDSPRSEKKSVPFRVGKLNFLRKLWSLAFLAKKLELISFFFYLLKLRILTVKKSKFFNGQKSSKNFFFEDLTHIYISIYTITNSFEKFYG